MQKVPTKNRNDHQRPCDHHIPQDQDREYNLICAYHRRGWEMKRQRMTVDLHVFIKYFQTLPKKTTQGDQQDPLIRSCIANSNEE